MSEYLSLALGSLVGFAIGWIGMGLWRKWSRKRAAKRQKWEHSDSPGLGCVPRRGGE